MPDIAQKSGLPIFRRQDHVGVLRHIVIFAVDGVGIYVVGIGFASISVVASESGLVMASWVPMPLFFVIAWWYLTVLKPSRFRSLGYWIADAKIITLEGRSPSAWRMTLRLFWLTFWMMGWPISFILDFAWTAIDHNRQMLRDVIAETRLIRNKAQPIATGRRSYSLVLGLGVAIFYAEVRECESKPSEPAVS